MTHIAMETGQRRHSAALHITTTQNNENSPVAQPLITMDEIHAVIVHNAFQKVQRHHHAAQADPEVWHDPEFLISLAEANAHYFEMFEAHGASAARASVKLYD